MAETLAFVIHQRPYQEHDTIVSLFTERYGLLPVFIKGSRGASLSSQHLRACLQPATLLDVDVLTSGHSLSQLRHVDSLSITPPLTSLAFVYLSYINEITRLFLNENSSVPEVFSAYKQCVLALLKADDEELAFRQLELALIKASCLTISFEVDGLAQPIQLDGCYDLDCEKGFFLVDSRTAIVQPTFRCSGLFIQGLNDADLSGLDNSLLKRLFHVLKHYLYPNTPIKSRDLYRALKRCQ